MSETDENVPEHGVPYTWNFFRVISPIELKLAAALAGIDTKPLDKPFTYCELGCGNGLTCNILADCFPQGRFYAVDMNPEHIANARGIAEKGKLSNISYYEATFGELLDEKFPKFDFIVLHGIYSWVNAGVRRDIREFIRKYLAPKGLVYVSYNSMPGWSYLLPIQQFLLKIAATQEGDPLQRMASALAQLSSVRDRGAPYFKLVPSAGEYLEELKKSNPNYLVHEYLIEDWQPRYFSEVVSELAEIDLAFCTSAERQREILHRSNTQKFPKLEKFIEDRIERESFYSLLNCEKFRLDIFVRQKCLKGRTTTTALDRWVFGHNMTRRSKIKFQPSDKNLMRKVVPVILGGVRTVAEVVAAPELKAFKTRDIELQVRDLLLADAIRPLTKKVGPSEKDHGGKLRLASDLNRALLQERLFDRAPIWLASPILGNGLSFSKLHAILLLATDAGELDHAAKWIWDLIQNKGIAMFEKDQKIESQAAFATYLEPELELFRSEVIPIARKLDILVPVLD